MTEFTGANLIVTIRAVACVRYSTDARISLLANEMKTDKYKDSAVLLS